MQAYSLSTICALEIISELGIVDNVCSRETKFKLTKCLLWVIYRGGPKKGNNNIFKVLLWLPFFTLYMHSTINSLPFERTDCLYKVPSCISLELHLRKKRKRRGKNYNLDMIDNSVDKQHLQLLFVRLLFVGNN